jgi:hypothetical protein
LNTLIHIIGAVNSLLQFRIWREVMWTSARIRKVQPLRTKPNRFIFPRHRSPRKPKTDILLGIEEIRGLHYIIQIDATEFEPYEEDRIAAHD